MYVHPVMVLETDEAVLQYPVRVLENERPNRMLHRLLKFSKYGRRLMCKTKIH